MAEPHEVKGMEHLAALPALRRQVLQQAMLRVGGETLSFSFMDPVGGSSCRVSKMLLLARNCNLGILLLSGISALPTLYELVTFPCS